MILLIVKYYICTTNKKEEKFRIYSNRTDKDGFKRHLKIYEFKSCFDYHVRNLSNHSKSNKNLMKKRSTFKLTQESY